MINLISFTIQSMRTAKQSTITSLARNGYVGIIAVLVMSLFGNVYVVAVAQPVADIISFVIALVMLKNSMQVCFSHTNEHKNIQNHDLFSILSSAKMPAIFARMPINEKARIWFLVRH